MFRWFVFLLLTTAAFATDRNITASGATCNGTTDDRTAVQTAINASVSGDRVTISAGCMAGIGATGLQLANKTNVQIVGLGAGAGFKALATTYNQTMTGLSGTMLLMITNCTSCRIDGVEFNMNFKQAAAIGMNGNVSTVINAVNMHDVGDGVVGAPGAALQAALNTNCTYSNNIVLHTLGPGPNGNGTRGLWIGNNGAVDTGATIIGNNITDTHHTGIVTFCSNCTTTLNTVYDSGTGATHNKAGGACQKDNYVAGTLNTITNNNYRYCGQGIQIENGGNLLIQGNTIRNILDGGIAFTPSGAGNNNVQILRNTFINCNNGVEMNGGTNVTVKNNTFTDDNTVGEQRSTNDVRLSPSQQNISGISITHNDIGKNSNAGIIMYDQTFGHTITTVDISNNSFTNSSRWGIDIQQTAAGAFTGITQSSNCFSANSSGAIHDSRGLLPNPAQSGSCATALEGAFVSCPAGGATPTPSFVQALSDSRAIGTFTLAFNMPAASTTGDTLACYIGLTDTANVIETVTNRAGDAFTQVSHSVTSRVQDLWVKNSINGSGVDVERITFGIQAVSGSSTIVCAQLHNAFNLEQTTAVSGATSTAATAGNVTTAKPDTLLLAGVAFPWTVNATKNGSCGGTGAATWNVIADTHSGTTIGSSLVYAIVSSTGTYCHSWTLGASGAWTGALQAFTAE